MAVAQLTPGAVVALSEHAEGSGTLRPVLQVVDVRMVSNLSNPSAERFRMVLSDGVHTTQSMLATAHNTRVRDGSIHKGSIVQLQEFTCSTIQQRRRIIIVIKLDVLQSECAIMGNPKPYEMRNQPNEQGTNLPANAAQANTGTCSSGPCMLGSSAAPRPAQGGYQGMLGPPIVRAAESVPNVASGVSSGTTSAHNSTMNAGMSQSNLQQPSLNSHQNQRFADPSMAGGSGAPRNMYGQPRQSFYQQPPPGHLVPVAQLNLYQDRWRIKARVTSKTPIRPYDNGKGAGRLFSFDLLDGQGGEIRATCFNAQVDQFFGLIEVDKVYLISNGNVRPARKKFNPLNNEYEINLDFRTSIELCVDDDSNIPRQQYNFRQIREIENIEVGAIVDLVGIVTSVGPYDTVIRNDGSKAQKRTLQLKDMSGRSIEITLWGKFCDAEGQQLQVQCDSGLNPVLALKGARVTEYVGRSVTSIGSTQLKIDPDFHEAESLQRWYATEGKTAACVSLSAVSMCKTDVRKAVAQIKDEDLGRSEKPDWITVKGAISHLSTDSFCYPACTMEVNGRMCNKKVIDNADGTWHCDKCNQSLPNCEYRYLLVCQIQDHTGVTDATAFQEAGIEMLGHSAQELYNIKEEDPKRFAEITQGVLWQQFLFMLKVKEDTFNDEQHVKCNIMKAEKLDLARESSYLLGVINGLLKDETVTPSEAQGPLAYNAGLSNTGAGQSVPTTSQQPAASSSGSSLPRYSAPRLCFKCNQPGHFADTCTQQQQQEPNLVFGLCFKCNQPGHFAAFCPLLQQPPNLFPRLCFKCKQPGHFADSCPLRLRRRRQQQQ